MCLAIPGKVIKVLEKVAEVEILGVKRNVAIDLVKNVKKGEYLLIHTGCAIDKIDEDEAEKTIELFKELEEQKDV
ncbi:MAG: HypC/HybG/HupF family hydrogenase formation chaperone [Clostridiales bacterium]